MFPIISLNAEQYNAISQHRNKSVVENRKDKSNPRKYF